MIPKVAEHPTATLTIEPMGLRKTSPRRHSITIAAKFGAISSRHGDKEHVAEVARSALAGFPPTNGEPDRRPVGDMTLPNVVGKPGTAGPSVVGVECSAIWPQRPNDESIERARAVLIADGYRVALREKRECVEPACASAVVVDWHHSRAPRGWYNETICGNHNYRECARCKSLYVMTNTNTAGQGPAVHCKVCGETMIAWGSSKTWTAELVTKRTP